ncbi:hypothetical protein FHX82_006354 [Amycolatopsis bartoniae]|uniref:Uncharacterized protein n=1 Tax=Amycolatopsis bartoniae TaxID=941986 RepID=A0A8H9MBT1_9PSEU|nr:hypothetical protein [Amycolatopsis bartoniae]MBB2939268.1 hypothetical protein [Amycolatopsis bartoniae]TVT08725.1 hypothetical protein FNH07_11410 [Amycolatopsis bartoniae]GHF37703.1 hypothetical protein GCM10017566_08630 [Amycolatopsis bartoniae]
MGIFGRSRAEQTIQAPGARDVPKLNPMWFADQLERAGKPLTTANGAAVAGLVGATLALSAQRWLDVVGTPEIRQRWDSLFGAADPDASARLTRPDRMIDFLWAVSPRLHPGLREFPDTMVPTVQARLAEFGPELPEDLGSDT